MAKRYKYATTQKQESQEGKASTIFAGISFGLFLIAIIVSFAFRGNGGIYLGAIGVMAICFAIYGFIRGLRSFSEDDCSHTYCVIGSISNGIIVVGWLALFLIGV